MSKQRAHDQAQPPTRSQHDIVAPIYDALGNTERAWQLGFTRSTPDKPGTGSGGFDLHQWLTEGFGGEPLATTQAGQTSLDPQVSSHPQRALIEAHEAVHRQQHQRFTEGGQPAGREALEDEAQHGSRALLAGQRFNARLASDPRMDLAFTPDEQTQRSQDEGTDPRIKEALEALERSGLDTTQIREALARNTVIMFEGSSNTRAWPTLFGEWTRGGDKIYLSENGDASTLAMHLAHEALHDTALRQGDDPQLHDSLEQLADVSGFGIPHLSNKGAHEILACVTDHMVAVYTSAEELVTSDLRSFDSGKIDASELEESLDYIRLCFERDLAAPITGVLLEPNMLGSLETDEVPSDHPALDWARAFLGSPTEDFEQLPFVIEARARLRAEP